MPVTGDDYHLGYSSDTADILLWPVPLSVRCYIQKCFVNLLKKKRQIYYVMPNSTTKTTALNTNSNVWEAYGILYPNPVVMCSVMDLNKTKDFTSKIFNIASQCLFLASCALVINTCRNFFPTKHAPCTITWKFHDKTWNEILWIFQMQKISNWIVFHRDVSHPVVFTIRTFTSQHYKLTCLHPIGVQIR